MKMPILVPIPIKTKSESVSIRVWKWITSIREWKLIEDWEYVLPDGPKIIVPKGFRFDGASIPRSLWALLSPTGLLLIPGLIHDFAYRYDYFWALDEEGNAYKYEEGAGRKFWDGIFKEVGIEVNGLAVIDTLAWFALATAGWWAWRSNRKLNAPELLPDKPLQSDKQNSESITE